MIFDVHQLILTALSTGVLAKGFLMFARTMPPPPENCGFWCRWFFNFVQVCAENQDRLGESAPIRKTATTVAQSTVVPAQAPPQSQVQQLTFQPPK